MNEVPTIPADYRIVWTDQRLNGPCRLLLEHESGATAQGWHEFSMQRAADGAVAALRGLTTSGVDDTG